MSRSSAGVPSKIQVLPPTLRTLTPGSPLGKVRAQISAGQDQLLDIDVNLPVRRGQVARRPSAEPCSETESRRVLVVLELVDYVHAKEQLVPALPGVVPARIPGVIEAQLRAEHHRAADVFGRKERVLGVLAGDSGALPLLVVQKLGHDEERGLM